MKITAAKKAEGTKQQVFLLDNINQLQSISLSSGELSYAESQLDGKGEVLVEINRYEEIIYLQKFDFKTSDNSINREKVRVAGNRSLANLKAQKAESVVIKALSETLNVLDFAEGIALGSYQFLKYFSDKSKRKNSLQTIYVDTPDKQAIKELNAAIAGVYKARDLVNEPVNFLTAVQLAKEAVKAGEKVGFKVEVLNKKKIETLKMGGLLAVNKGSQDPPTFTIMEHIPAKAINASPVILVGKGVVYDTGGLSLKPTANSMDSMKSDMGGAAAVLGTMIAVAQAKLPVHVIGLIPATDNRPGEKAYTPGDVIKMFDGSTVEVLNTDAEGRMILADALAYAKKYKPELVIDLATLTGAAAVAVGKYGTVSMGTASDDQFNKLEEAGFNVYERLARFPFWDDYNDLLKSTIADVKNIGGREGGAITAGKFLERFTDYPWIHLDIAGPAFLSSDHEYRKTGGTGVGVRMLFEFLKKYS